MHGVMSRVAQLAVYRIQEIPHAFPITYWKEIDTDISSLSVIFKLYYFSPSVESV
jgi:hypothetical protein